MKLSKRFRFKRKADKMGNTLDGEGKNTASKSATAVKDPGLCESSTDANKDSCGNMMGDQSKKTKHDLTLFEASSLAPTPATNTFVIGEVDNAAWSPSEGGLGFIGEPMHNVYQKENCNGNEEVALRNNHKEVTINRSSFQNDLRRESRKSLGNVSDMTDISSENYQTADDDEITSESATKISDIELSILDADQEMLDETLTRRKLQKEFDVYNLNKETSSPQTGEISSDNSPTDETSYEISDVDDSRCDATDDGCDVESGIVTGGIVDESNDSRSPVFDEINNEAGIENNCDVTSDKWNTADGQNCVTSNLCDDDSLGHDSAEYSMFNNVDDVSIFSNSSLKISIYSETAENCDIPTEKDARTEAFRNDAQNSNSCEYSQADCCSDKNGNPLSASDAVNQNAGSDCLQSQSSGNTEEFPDDFCLAGEISDIPAMNFDTTDEFMAVDHSEWLLPIPSKRKIINVLLNPDSVQTCMSVFEEEVVIYSPNVEHFLIISDQNLREEMPEASVAGQNDTNSMVSVVEATICESTEMINVSAIDFETIQEIDGVLSEDGTETVTQTTHSLKISETSESVKNFSEVRISEEREFHNTCVVPSLQLLSSEVEMFEVNETCVDEVMIPDVSLEAEESALEQEYIYDQADIFETLQHPGLNNETNIFDASHECKTTETEQGVRTMDTISNEINIFESQEITHELYEETHTTNIVVETREIFQELSDGAGISETKFVTETIFEQLCDKMDSVEAVCEMSTSSVPLCNNPDIEAIYDIVDSGESTKLECSDLGQEIIQDINYIHDTIPENSSDLSFENENEIALTSADGHHISDINKYGGLQDGGLQDDSAEWVYPEPDYSSEEDGLLGSKQASFEEETALVDDSKEIVIPEPDYDDSEKDYVDREENYFDFNHHVSSANKSTDNSFVDEEDIVDDITLDEIASPLVRHGSMVPSKIKLKNASRYPRKSVTDTVIKEVEKPEIVESTTFGEHIHTMRISLPDQAYKYHDIPVTASATGVPQTNRCEHRRHSDNDVGRRQSIPGDRRKISDLSHNGTRKIDILEEKTARSSIPNDKKTSVTNIDGQSIQKYTVILRQEKSGYGMTFIDNRPVRIDKVTIGGVASRCGLQVGDELFIINGTNVYGKDQVIVVNIIKTSGPHVEMTVLRKTSSSSSRPNSLRDLDSIRDPRISTNNSSLATSVSSINAPGLPRTGSSVSLKSEQQAFHDLDLLRKPSVCAAFLDNLLQQGNSNCLLFTMICQYYQKSGIGVKDVTTLAKWAYEIYTTFLIDKAPLKITIPDAMIPPIESLTKLKENELKLLFRFADRSIQKRLSEIFQEYLQKNDSFEDFDPKIMDNNKELRAVDQILWKHFETLIMDDKSDQKQALAVSLATFFHQIGLPAVRNSTLLENCPTFVSKDKKSLKKLKKHPMRGHSLIPHHYANVTLCHVCQKIIWGFGYQAYKCSMCDLNVHQYCTGKLFDVCVGTSSRKRLMDMLRNPLVTPDDAKQHPMINRNEDSDFEVEQELPSLSDFIPKDELKKLKPKEHKCQQTINELFHTERLHIKNLKVMRRFFQRPMLEDPGMRSDFVNLLFPNLDEVIRVHKNLSEEFKSCRKSNAVVSGIGERLLTQFGGVRGEQFKKACADFCKDQSYALEVLGKKQKKEKLAQFLQEAATHPLCRRQSLKDFLPREMQRLTKYPLFIDTLLHHTMPDTEEFNKLTEALQLTKSLLEYVNQEARECQNARKVDDLQKRLDRRSIDSSNLLLQNLDLTKHRILHDGPLQWLLSDSRPIDLHVVLFEDIIVLLQKQEDRFVLRSHNTTINHQKFTYCPVMNLTNLHTTIVPREKGAFYLASRDPPQMYKLLANTKEEQNRWSTMIQEAVKNFKDPSISNAPIKRTRQMPTVSSFESINESINSRTSENSPDISMNSYVMTNSILEDLAEASEIEDKNVEGMDTCDGVHDSSGGVAKQSHENNEHAIGLREKIMQIHEAMIEKFKLLTGCEDPDLSALRSNILKESGALGQMNAREIVSRCLEIVDRLVQMCAQPLKNADGSVSVNAPELMSISASVELMLSHALSLVNSEDEENAKILETVQDMRHKLGIDASPDCTFESSRHESFYGTSNSTFDAGSHTSAFDAIHSYPSDEERDSGLPITFVTTRAGLSPDLMPSDTFSEL